jgi:sarcosine oxidase subunit beta
VLPSRAPVVIVGGGVIGTSALFHLAEAGIRNAVLIERAELASGSTSRAAGGVRAQFSDGINIQIAQRSLAAFSDFARRPGWEIDLQKVGYLFLLTRPADVEAFRLSIELQNTLGVPSRLLTSEEAQSINPLIDASEVLAAAYSPDDGHATPEAVVHGYAHGARAHGACIVTGCEVLEIEMQGGEIRRLRTSQGYIETSTVICAAGAWSQPIAAMAGVDLPVTPVRRQILFTEPVRDLPSHLPMTIDFASSFYFHREGQGLLVGMSWPHEQPGFATGTTDDWIPDLLQVAERRAPIVARAGIRGGWAGLYEMSPDHNALIGEATMPSRFLYATGFSGHGFLQGPAVGEILRDLYLGREPFVSVHDLSANRFTQGATRPEMNIV